MQRDPIAGAAADCGGIGAGGAPGPAQGRDLAEPQFPLGPDPVLQHLSHQCREAGALAVGRDRHRQIAAPEHRGRVEIAALAVVLDIDQDPGRLCHAADFACRGFGNAGDKDEMRPRDLGRQWQPCKQPPATSASPGSGSGA